MMRIRRGDGWRIAFWYAVHDAAEAIWHWVYVNRIRPWRDANDPPIVDRAWRLVGQLPATEEEKARGVTHRDLYMRAIVFLLLVGSASSISAQPSRQRETAAEAAAILARLDTPANIGLHPITVAPRPAPSLTIAADPQGGPFGRFPAFRAAPESWSAVGLRQRQGAGWRLYGAYSAPGRLSGVRQNRTLGVGALQRRGR